MAAGGGQGKAEPGKVAFDAHRRESRLAGQAFQLRNCERGPYAHWTVMYSDSAPAKDRFGPRDEAGGEPVPLEIDGNDGAPGNAPHLREQADDGLLGKVMKQQTASNQIEGMACEG